MLRALYRCKKNFWKKSLNVPNVKLSSIYFFNVLGFFTPFSFKNFNLRLISIHLLFCYFLLLEKAPKSQKFSKRYTDKGPSMTCNINLIKIDELGINVRISWMCRYHPYDLAANIFESGPMPTPWKFLDRPPLLPSCKSS